jgi:hypothetical protein
MPQQAKGIIGKLLGEEPLCGNAGVDDYTDYLRQMVRRSDLPSPLESFRLRTESAGHAERGAIVC